MNDAEQNEVQSVEITTETGPVYSEKSHLRSCCDCYWEFWNKHDCTNGNWLLIICHPAISFLICLALAVTVPVFIFAITDEFTDESIDSCFNSYDLTPYAIILLGCLGSIISKGVTMTNLPDQIISPYVDCLKQKCGCAKKDKEPKTSGAKNQGSEIIGPQISYFSALLSIVFLLSDISSFSRRVEKDMEIIFGDANQSTWTTYECYGFILWSSTNLRSIWFSFFFIIVKEITRGPIQEDNAHWLNKSLINLAFKWNILTAAIYFLALTPTIVTHILPALILYPYFWITGYLCGWGFFWVIFIFGLGSSEICKHMGYNKIWRSRYCDRCDQCHPAIVPLRVHNVAV